MKVAFVITGLGVGGAEKVVCDLADELTARGNEVLVIYLTGQALVQPKSPGVKVVGPFLGSLLGGVACYFRLRSILSRFKPDVVHAHLFHAIIMMRLLRLSLGIKRLVCTAHSARVGGRARVMAYKLTDWLATISTNVSEEAAESFFQSGASRPGRMFAVHNGISTSAFVFDGTARASLRSDLGVAEFETMIVSVGRLDAPKDYPNLLRAASHVLASAPAAQFFIAGDGPLRQDLLSLRDELQLTDSVHFLGLRRDVASLLSAADIFVLSSAWEGFPLVVGEAMSCERTLVATDCGGIKEFVGDAGLMVRPNDSRELAQAVLNALAMTDDARAELGRRARERVISLYSLEATVDRWVSIYHS